MVSDQTRLKMREKPNKTPLIYQNWRNLLFLHWACDPDLIQKTLPKGLYVDTFEGNAYLGIVPFSIQDQRLGPFPLPGFSNFTEINVRTYVYDEKGTPGVWFISLDINSALAATMGRLHYALPYVSSQNQLREKEGVFEYLLKRKNMKPIHYSYHPKDQTQKEADTQSLEFFLVERYVLFSKKEDILYQAQVHHEHYPLCPVDVLVYDEELLEWNGFPRFLRSPDHAIFSSGVNVSIYNIEKTR